MRFTEKCIINNYIETISDPYRNNLATRNPQTVTEVERLLENDFQYLKSNTNSNIRSVKPINNSFERVMGTNFPNTQTNF